MTILRVNAKVAATLISRRSQHAHKGTSGRVLIVAGSRGMVGAAVLAATAAVRSGAGLVRLATVHSQQRAAIIRAPLEITTHALAEDKKGQLAVGALSDLRQLIKKFQPTVIAVGPGLGLNRTIERLIRWLTMSSSTPLVLDADGLNALSKLKIRRPFQAPVIITPHVGELSRLLNASSDAIGHNRVRFARQVATRFGCVCLLKGAGTIVTDGRRAYENTSGNPAMASGGMGDVLTGLVAAAWAQAGGRAAAALPCAAFAAFLHGFCADLAVRAFPERTLLASDLIGFLPQAFQKIWRFK